MALFLLSFPVHLVAFATFSSIFPVFLDWHCALSLLSFVATGKPVTRWRLALAQQAVRGTFIRPSSFLVFSYFDSVVLIRIQTAHEDFPFKRHWLTRP